MQSQVQSKPIINFPNLYKFGMVLTRESDDLLNISAGACRDSTNTIDIVLGDQNVEGSIVEAPLVIDFNKEGINGIDTGTVLPSVVYAIYMIADSRYYLPTGCIATLSSNVMPMMPRGYDSYRLIGYWSTDVSSILQRGYYFGESNDLTFYYSSQKSVGSVTTGSGDFDLSKVVPTIDNVEVELQVTYTGSVATNVMNIYNGFNDGADYVVIFCQVASIPTSEQFQLMTGPLTTGKPTIHYTLASAGDNASAYVTSFSVSI